MITAAFQRIPLLRNPRPVVRTPGAIKVAVLCLMGVGVSGAADTPAQDAHAWLERMSRALSTRNYDGRFLHLVGGHAENMRIIHRVADGGATERLVSLDGSGRELIRTGSELVYYLPDRRQVMVEKRSGGDSLLAAVPTYSDALQAHYTLTAAGTARILGRPAQLVAVQPRDNFRYGYRLWLDQETAMPLKSQLCDRTGRVIEQIVFADLSMPATIDAALLKTSIATDGFQWIRQDARAKHPATQLGAAPAATNGQSGSQGWIVANPPRGFRITVTRTQSIGGAATPVRHLVLSDGLASVSVFIEQKSGAAGSEPAVPELARVGSALAYSTETADHRITAVGEVPADTLRAIASSVQRDSPADTESQAR